MLEIDRAILTTNQVICDNISKFSCEERGIMSQNILGHIRNFVEYVAIKVYANGKDVDPNNYKVNVAALKELKKNGNLAFLRCFHDMLQKSVSHYTLDQDASERLMLKYYEYLLRIKEYLKQNFDLDVLDNINSFPLKIDTELSDYYEKIVERIEVPSEQSNSVDYNELFYVQKVKPFFVRQKIYYEVTFIGTNTRESKFNRIIAFTKHEIIDNYSVKFSLHNDIIHILNKNMPILVIDAYEVVIQPKEWNFFLKFLESI